MQLHLLFAGSAEREEFVDISSVRIAASRSESAVEAPCMAFPPVMFIFVFGAGEALREGFWEVTRDEAVDLDFLPKSDIKVPAAEGGGRGIGAWMAAGVLSSAKAFEDVDCLEFDGTGVDFRDT